MSPKLLSGNVSFSRTGAGQQFRCGVMLAGFLAAANCDPTKFEKSSHFDITRHPNPRLSFGTGVHFCLGFQLARAEAAIGFERILARFPDMRLVAGKIEWHKRLGIRAQRDGNNPKSILEQEVAGQIIDGGNRLQRHTQTIAVVGR